MHRILVGVFVFTVANATVITNTTCEVDIGLNQTAKNTGVNACLATIGTAGMASAASTASVTLPATTSDFLTISVNQSIQDRTNPPSPGVFTTAISEADAVVNLLLTSAGPPRTGVVQFSAPNPWGLGAFDVSGLMSVSFGPLSGNCGPALPVSCTGIFNPGGGRAAFPLGQTVLLDVTSMLRGVDIQGEGPGSFSGSTELGFRLFESDGVTPVAIQVVPEPAAWFLSALGLSILAGFRRRRVR